jgi:carboxypeptidase Q
MLSDGFLSSGAPPGRVALLQREGAMSVLLRQRPLLVSSVLAAALMLVPVSAQQAPEKIDYDGIYKIKDEGFARSKVMEIESWLTDVYGPRLTNSPNYRKAGDWAVKQLTEWGIVNAKLEPWGPFGRGWSNDKFYVQALAPTRFPVIGYPKAWTNGTDGLISGEAIMADIQTDEDYAKFKGQLKGKFVFVTPMRDVAASFTPLGHRYTEQELADLQSETDVRARGGRGGARAGAPGRQGGPGAPAVGGRGAGQNPFARRLQFFKDEGALAIIDAGRGDGGTVFVQSAPGVSRDAGTDAGLPQITFAIEHYGRLVRAMEKGVPVKLEMDVKNSFYDDNPQSFNVVGEIPGTDKANEIVMLGAHFDSWHGGTGATDNAAGSAVMMEAMRILKQSGVRLRRTVRIGLWGGEEQGLLGSRAYVTEHFANREDMLLKPEHARVSGYFNVDNGTGAIRGVYLQGNEAAAPIFEEWMKPFHNLGMTTLTIRDTGGTDHQSFDAVGLPGFQFIQDPVEYDTRTHHSNMDVYERIQEADMRQNAVIVAAFVYQTANRDDKLPRKPLPKPQARGRGTTPSGGF